MADPADLLRRAKHRMAQALIGARDAVSLPLGDITLRPHQATAVARLLEILATYRGALLADVVGLGKTYVALAVAREYASATVACPSRLRGIWNGAMTAANMQLSVISIEALSRGATPPSTDLLIIDEAHHLRTPGTRRYEVIAHVARQARLLLLSATPLHNSRRDLTALLALFAGPGVKTWPDDALARLIVRRDGLTASETLPAIDGPHALTPGADDDCLDAILALPPTIPAADEGEAHALMTISLLHLWSSSRAALVSSVKKRLARATALQDAASLGRMPTAAELSAWRFADDSLQLAFPIFAASTPVVEPNALMSQLDDFIRSARALLDSCRESVDPDHHRAELLRVLRRRHAGARIVAFSQYAHTVNALGRLLREETGVAVVTASGARIASGSVTRDEVLAQYTANPAPVRLVERIDLVLTTDLMSEGIDLRGASVIVHLDLPWNPARMEQRVGRARRLGSPHDTIHVYTFVPPAAAERMLELRRRLGRKIDMARAIVGSAFDPLGESMPADSSSVQEYETLRARMANWIDAAPHGDDRAPVVAAARSTHLGWIAVVAVGGLTRVITCLGRGITDDAALATTVVDEIGPPCEVDTRRRHDSEALVYDWLAVQRSTGQSSIPSAAKRAILERLFETVSRAPRHRRPDALRSAQRARAGLSAVAGVGTERALSALARSADGDEAWLQAVAAFGEVLGGEDTYRDRDGLVALILLEPVSPAAAATPG